MSSLTAMACAEQERVPVGAPTTLAPALLAWWREHGRHELPWRRTRDPWAVLVSELMLQQTRVPRVVPKFEAFLERFPTPVACAAAPVSEVIGAWAGLGYNRRAVNLHRLATAVVHDHGGTIPDDLGDLLRLPGVGPYTARAVLAFAFERDVGLVDTTAGRFLARAVAGRAVRRAEAQRLADEAVPPGQAWAWGQAVFDIAVAACTRNEPACGACPVRRECAWSRAGFPEPDPVAGSAGVSGRQSRFDGSDRQGRGRLVARLRHGPVGAEEVAAAAGWPGDPDRARRVAASLAADGLAVLGDDGGLRLP